VTAQQVSWDDIKPGVIIRYRHLSKERRLSGAPLVVRRARVERVNRRVHRGQITIVTLNKNGSVHGRIRRGYLYGLDFIESVESS
jgi:hypothetical protein